MTGLTEPPEGVLAGESVPRENEREAKREAAISRLAAELKEHPAYADWSAQERREAAVKRLEDLGVINA